MQGLRCNCAVPDARDGDCQTDGNRDGSDHGRDDGTGDGAFCRRCDDRVRPDPAGRCPDCGIFLAGNPGGEVIRRDRRAELRRAMADVEADLTEDLGGPGEVTAAQRILIRQATHTELLASALIGAVVKAGPGTEAGQKATHSLLAVLDRQHRALSALGAELHVQAEVGMKVDTRWPDALTADERLVAQWLFARAMARRGQTEAQDALATDGPSAYMKALVGLVRAEAASVPTLPPGPEHDQEVLDAEVVDDEVLDAEVVDDDEEEAA